MTQKQIGIFKFGHPETQSNEDFVCIVSPEKKLSPNAPEFIPTIHSDQPEHPEFIFDLSKKDFDTDDDESISSYEKIQTSTNREFQCSDSNSESDSCPRIQMKVTQNLVNLIRIMKHAMQSHILTFQKVSKILRMMNHVSQSLKISLGKVISPSVAHKLLLTF